MKRYMIVAISLVLLGIAIGMLMPEAKEPVRAKVRRVSGEYINPGTPKGLKGGDWFEAGSRNAENPSLSEVMQRARYPILLRLENGKPIEPIRIFVQPQAFGPEEHTVEGFGFCYRNRVHITIDLSDKPLDIEAVLAQEEMTLNTRGETKLYFRTEVRGTEAIGREAGVQKWEYGTENSYPAMVTWTERGNDEAPYLIYTATGDGRVSELKAIAESLGEIAKMP